ncbi:MAG: glycosyltransferase family 4 protein [Candidatus Kerfeldbacteria bacterium]|nr:glycosyltransferase family 4 protein [Candidatus Kerfeldbacteria bacterium]
MKIGIDCRTILNPKLGERAGVGHYTYNLVKHLLRIDKTNTYYLYFDHRIMDTGEFSQANVHIKQLPFSQYNKFLPFAYSHMLISAYLLKHNLDVFHSPITSVPLTYPKKTVVTVHDLAIYKNPAWFPSQIFSTRLLVPRAVSTADHIIAVSESTKQDLKELFNVPSRKVTVTHEGVDVRPVRVHNTKIDSLDRFKLGKRFIFFMGTLEPRKNVSALLRAYKKFLESDARYPKVSFAQYQLVLAGAKGFKHEEIFDLIRQLKLQRQVKYLGYVTHNQKIALMKRAACFAFPSSYEGFGLPVLEAMALGTPVITSNVSSLPEIAGKAALLVNPENDQEIARALQKLLSDPSLQKRLGLVGEKQAARFSWDEVARKTLVVYKKV